MNNHSQWEPSNSIVSKFVTYQDQQSFFLKKLILFFSAFIIATPLLFGQSIQERLDGYNSNIQMEKIYVHHDKPFYLLGDTIWCKVYLVDGFTNQPVNRNEIVYFDWVNPEGLILQTYFLEAKNGLATIDIPVNINEQEGQYTMRAYTLYQKNFDEAFIFQKKIELTGFEKLAKEDTESTGGIELQFFPEGGYMIEGVASRIAFKCVIGNGRAKEVKGSLIDNEGKVISNIFSIHDGMGVFEFVPERSKQYELVIDEVDTQFSYKLPKALKKGTVLGANASQKDKVALKILSSEDFYEGVLVGQNGNNVFFEQVINTNLPAALSLDKLELPEGLLHFTLFDKKNRAVSERLVYNHLSQDSFTVEIEVLEAYNTRDRVEFQMSIDQMEDLDTAFLSLSIYNESYVERDLNSGLNIKNYLMLQSELNGRVSGINNYFKGDSKSRQLMDLLLMTHGWSKFSWQEVLDGKLPKIYYPLEGEFSISGQTVKDDSAKPVKSSIIMNLFGTEALAINNVETAEDGIFHIENLGFKDTTGIYLQANKFGKKQKKLKEGEIKRVGRNDIDINIIDLHELAFDSSYSIPLDPSIYELVELEYDNDENVEALVLQNLGLQDVDSSFWSLEMDEIVVKSSKLSKKRKKLKELQRKYIDRGIFYFSSTEKFFADEIFEIQSNFRSVYEMVKHVIPVSYIRGPVGDKEIWYNTSRGFAKALTGLNGNLISSTLLENIEPLQIETIELVDSYRAQGIFGTAGLVVHFFTKEDFTLADVELTKMKNGTLHYVHPGFYKARDFYHKMYEGDEFEIDIDNRVTVYWNPDIAIGNETLDFSFYTSGLSGKYRFQLEGVTKSGRTMVSNEWIQVGGIKPQ